MVEPRVEGFHFCSGLRCPQHMAYLAVLARSGSGSKTPSTWQTWMAFSTLWQPEISLLCFLLSLTEIQGGHSEKVIRLRLTTPYGCITIKEHLVLSGHLFLPRPLPLPASLPRPVVPPRIEMLGADPSRSLWKLTLPGFHEELTSDVSEHKGVTTGTLIFEKEQNAL